MALVYLGRAGRFDCVAGFQLHLVQPPPQLSHHLHLSLVHIGRHAHHRAFLRRKHLAHLCAGRSGAGLHSPVVDYAGPEKEKADTVMIKSKSRARYCSSHRDLNLITYFTHAKLLDKSFCL